MVENYSALGLEVPMMRTEYWDKGLKHILWLGCKYSESHVTKEAFSKEFLYVNVEGDPYPLG